MFYNVKIYLFNDRLVESAHQCGFIKYELYRS